MSGRLNLTSQDHNWTSYGLGWLNSYHQINDCSLCTVLCIGVSFHPPPKMFFVCASHVFIFFHQEVKPEERRHNCFTGAHEATLQGSITVLFQDKATAEITAVILKDKWHPGNDPATAWEDLEQRALCVVLPPSLLGLEQKVCRKTNQRMNQFECTYVSWNGRAVSNNFRRTRTTQKSWQCRALLQVHKLLPSNRQSANISKKHNAN